MDIFEMEGVSDPQISPDGSKILYVRSGSDIMKDKRYSNIWIIIFSVSIICAKQMTEPKEDMKSICPIHR